MGGEKINTDFKKIFILIGIGFLLFVIILIIVYLVFFQPQKSQEGVKDPSITTEYKDPYSNEVVITNTNQAKEEETLKSNNITFLGFNTLLQRGINSPQIDILKSLYIKYSSQNKNYIQELSIDISSIKHIINSDSGENIITFDTIINRKDKYISKINYSGITDLNLVIYDLSDNVLFNESYY